MKKFTVMPSDHGGRLDVDSKARRHGTSFAEEFESEAVDLAFEAVHRPKRGREGPAMDSSIQRNPKVCDRHAFE